MPPADPRILCRLSDRVRPHGPHAEGIRARLGSALLVRDAGDALALGAVLPVFDLVALDGTVVTGRGEVFQRQRGAPELGLLGRRRLSRQAGTECDELRRLLGGQEARGAELTRLSRESAEQESAASQRVAVLSRELATLAAREGELSIARQRLAGRERLLDEETASLTDDLAGWERGAERAREEITLSEDLRRALETSAAQAQEEAERRRGGLAALHAMLENSRARQAEAERLKAVQAQKAEALLRRAADLVRRADTLDDQARVALERGCSLSQQVRAGEEGLKSLLAERGRAQAARSGCERQAEDLRLAAESGQETLRAQQAELEAIRESARDRQVALARADSDWEHLSHECRQELDMAIEQAVCAEGETLPERAICDQQLQELREDLNRLGPVNLLALDEYQELEKRHEFLTIQHKDLDQSVESLKNTIQRLNRRSREQFLTAFEAIRVHFHELFRLLFGGGRAELRLEEGEDVLECGLEVNVQPPGKRLQSIQLLSGGEKALAALALLFSIFRYKPSPFCLLDEVDAALDESNVERFLRIVRDFQQNTQFVLITHNKRSMEIADFLYGVTMEEPGVSKLVSVNMA
jgi:chromosome segregation protein